MRELLDLVKYALMLTVVATAAAALAGVPLGIAWRVARLVAGG